MLARQHEYQVYEWQVTYIPEGNYHCFSSAAVDSRSHKQWLAGGHLI